MSAPEPVRVLIVEDDPDIALIERMVLRRAGFVATVATRGDEALASVAAERPGVVLLDIMMPGCDGWSVLEEIVARPRPPVVIVCSARGSERDVERARELGAVAFLPKPFDIEDIVSAVRAAAAGRLADGESLAAVEPG